MPISGLADVDQTERVEPGHGQVPVGDDLFWGSRGGSQRKRQTKEQGQLHSFGVTWVRHKIDRTNDFAALGGRAMLGPVRSFWPHPELTGVDPATPPAQRYLVVGRIAAGAMGQIFLARMRRQDGPPLEVVLKRVKPELQVEREIVDMFYDEARIASGMNHPNIIRIYELGELDGSLFISMELVEGVNLAGLLRHATVVRRLIPLDLTLLVAISALDALDYAHRFADQNGRPLNIVHRDVSPQNLMISFGGEVKLFDFGVTKAEGRLTKTHPGLLKGKLAYMAPEQVRGTDAVDARADLFALGTVLYESLLYRHPFYGKTDAMVLKAIIEDQPPDPRTLDPRFPEDLAAILMRALAKDPSARYPTAAAFRSDLDLFLARHRALPSRYALADFMKREFGDRITALDRARRRGDDSSLVQVLQGRIENSSAPPRLEPQRLREPPRPRLALQAPGSAKYSFPAADDRLHLAESVTGDLRFTRESDDTTGPFERPSLTELLEEQLGTPKIEAPRMRRPEVTAPRAGRYALTERLYEGPVEIWRGRLSGPRGFEKPVLIERPTEPAWSELVVRTAILASSWKHPNLVEVWELADDAGYFRVVEAAGGWTVGEVLERCRETETTIPPPICVRIGQQVAAALLYLHGGGAGVPALHLEVAPYNVVLAKNGMVRLRGFDRCRAKAGEERGLPFRELTYAAPETLSADGVETAATDVYGVALLLDACFTGAARFSRSTSSATRAAILASRPRRDDLPAALADTIEYSLALQPSDRRFDIRSMAKALFDARTTIGPCDSDTLASWLHGLFSRDPHPLPPRW